ncbi:hypothetical protein L9F63_002820, partial [Diploptera punctata]
WRKRNRQLFSTNLESRFFLRIRSIVKKTFSTITTSKRETSRTLNFDFNLKLRYKIMKYLPNRFICSDFGTSPNISRIKKLTFRVRIMANAESLKRFSLGIFAYVGPIVVCWSVFGLYSERQPFVIYQTSLGTTPVFAFTLRKPPETFSRDDAHQPSKSYGINIYWWNQRAYSDIYLSAKETTETLADFLEINFGSGSCIGKLNVCLSFLISDVYNMLLIVDEFLLWLRGNRVLFLGLRFLISDVYNMLLIVDDFLLWLRGNRVLFLRVELRTFAISRGAAGSTLAGA